MIVLDFVIPLNREDLCGIPEPNQFSISSIYDVQETREKVEAARVALSEEGTDFIFDHFQTFFSIFQKFPQTSEPVKQKAWTTLTKCFRLLTNNLTIMFEDSASLDSEVQNKMCNVSKMIVYCLIEMMKLYQDKVCNKNTFIDGKGKKKQAKTTNEDGWDWNEEKHKVLVDIYNFLLLPLKMLWEPPVVEEEFVNLISNFCYKCLEDLSISNVNMKYLRETIFQILGTLIKQYLHGLSFCMKTVQLLKMNEHLVNPLAQGIVQLVNECNCNNIVKEIVREIANTDTDELCLDSGGTRSLNLFLVQLAEDIPQSIVPVIHQLMHHLDGDSYSMRLCVLGVIGEITLALFSKESLDENLKVTRDEFLDVLEDHLHDVNAFVRTRTLQIWQKLCLAKAVPITRLNVLLELTIGRLKDKSSNVKKQAVILIKHMLEGNPYSGQLSSNEISRQLKDEEKRLSALNNENKKMEHEINFGKIEAELRKSLENFKTIDEDDTVGEDENFTLDQYLEKIHQNLHDKKYQDAVRSLQILKNKFEDSLDIDKSDDDTSSLLTLLRQMYLHGSRTKPLDKNEEELDAILQLEKTVKYLQDALSFAELIESSLPVIITFLDSGVVSDVLEAINFFTSAYLFGFKQALDGVRKMLLLIYSKEANVKNAVTSAYKDLYFHTSSTGRQHAVIVIKNLSNLVIKLNLGQLNALEQIVREWVKSDVLDKACIQVLFERFSMKIPGTTESQCWAALTLIRMIGAEEPKVIKENIQVLLDQGLRSRNNKTQFLMASETCRALHKLVPVKQPGTFSDQQWRYPRNHDIINRLYVLVRDGLWNIDDKYYTPFTDQVINLIFDLSEHPDCVAQQLIMDLYKRIVSGQGGGRDKKCTSGNVLARDEDLDDMFEDEQVAEQEAKDKTEVDDNLDKTNVIVLTRFISLLGQIAANYVLYLEGPVIDELKIRNMMEYEKKVRKCNDNKLNKSKMNRSRGGALKKLESSSSDSVMEDIDKTMTENTDLEFNRVAADDMDTDEMKKITEEDVVTGCGLLAKFAPLLVHICSNQGKYPDVALQNSALLSLSKFMFVSSVFCENNLQLLVTICERSKYNSLRENAMIALGALQYRFPNTLEPWTPNMYAMLRDKDPSVRLTSIMVLTDLIVNEMIKARNNISDLAESIVDKQVKITQAARHFFREYSQKGSALYNILPTLISNLTQKDTKLNEEEFKTVIKFVLGQITKDKQVEHLVEKLCQYFDISTTERQWRDLAYCLSLLNYTEKGLKKLLENFKFFANKLYIAEVYECFCQILSNSAKSALKDNKKLVDELQVLIKEYREKSCDDKNIVYSTVKKKNNTTAKKRRTKESSSSSSDSDEPKKKGKKLNFDTDDSEMSTSSAPGKRLTRTRKKTVYDVLEEVDEDEDDHFVMETLKKNTRKKCEDYSSSSSDSDEQSKPVKQPKTKMSTAKKTKVKNNRESSALSSGDEVVERQRKSRSTRKRK